MSLIHHEKTQITLDTETGLMWQDDIDAKKLEFNYSEALKYSENLRLGGFSDWEIPDIDSLYKLHKELNKLKNFKNDKFYFSSTIAEEFGKNRKSVFDSISTDSHEDFQVFVRCVRKEPILYKTLNELYNYKRISDNSITLFSLKNELNFLKYDNNEYFGYFEEILKKIDLPEINFSVNLSEIINQKSKERIQKYLEIDSLEKESLTKDEFETKTEFDERINQFILEYNKRVENLGDIKKDFLFEIFAQTMGIPLLKDAFYDAETNDMYMTLFMTNYFWEKRIKVNIQDRIVAKDFKTKLNEVKIDATFDLENEEFIFDKVELEFDNNKFTGTQTNEVINQEKIKIDFHLTEEILDLEHQKDIQLPKYTLEVKTLDNQKLEEEIQILKEKLQISEDNNQNNEILNQEIEELKESKLSLENILSIKEDKIISLKNDNKIILIQIEDLKQELVSKNSEIEVLGKSNLKIHEITSHFENILKIKEDEIISFKNTNEKIIKDNQVLNNQLINKNYEIEELKKYCNELQLNSSKQEQQTLSKVVERESFSDF